MVKSKKVKGCKKKKTRIKKMEKARKAMTCVECLKTLESPVFLPCSHSICQQHVKDNKISIKCRECEVEHKIPENTGFPRNYALEDIISASPDFDTSNISAAIILCRGLNYSIEDARYLLNDSLATIRQDITELTDRVEKKRHDLKQTIDDAAEQVLKLVKEFENKCIDLLNNKALHDQKRIEYEEVLKKAETDLVSWSKALTEMNFQEKQPKEIISKCNETLKSLYSKRKSLISGFFDESEFQINGYAVEAFENMNIL